MSSRSKLTGLSTIVSSSTIKKIPLPKPSSSFSPSHPLIIPPLTTQRPFVQNVVFPSNIPISSLSSLRPTSPPLPDTDESMAIEPSIPPPPPPIKHKRKASLSQSSTKKIKLAPTEKRRKTPSKKKSKDPTEKKEKKKTGPKKKQEVVLELKEDEKKVTVDKDAPTTRFSHYLAFHKNVAPGTYSTSNQIMTEVDFERQTRHHYIHYAINVAHMMTDIRQCRRLLPPRTSAAKRKTYIELNADQQLRQYERELRELYKVKEVNLQKLHHEYTSQWVPEDEYQTFIQSISATEFTDPESSEITLPSHPIQILFGPRTWTINKIRAWNNQILDLIRDSDTRPQLILFINVFLYSKPVPPKNIIKFSEYQELFFHKYGTPVVYLPCHLFSMKLYAAHCTPRYTQLDVNCLPPPIEKIKKKRFKPLFTTDPMVMLADIPVGTLLELTSYINNTQVIGDYMRVVYRPSFYGTPPYMRVDPNSTLYD